LSSTTQDFDEKSGDNKKQREIKETIEFHRRENPENIRENKENLMGM